MEPLIVGDLMEKYVRNTLRSEEGFLRELRDYAIENNVPIIHPEVGKLIEILFACARPKACLEIGTAIGYSSLFFSKCMTKGRVDTIEVDPDMVLLARDNIAKAGYSEQINVICGDALEVLPYLTGSYDVVFVDGPKAKYIEMLPDCLRMLKKGGMLISDNVFYRGFLATPDSRIPQKRRALVRNLREYLDVLCKSDALETSLLSIGDGVAVTVKKE